MTNVLRQNYLFSPWTIPGTQLTLANRIVIPPMCMYSATDGKMGAFHHMHVGSMCTSGAGLVILEATGVVPEGRITPDCCGLWDEETAAAMKVVLDEVRQYSKNTPIAIQLAHAGRKASCYRPYYPNKSGQIPPGHADGGWQTVAPSALPFEAGDVSPRALSKEDIKHTIEAFAAAAKRADAIGIDAIELHFAHGYLAHEFLSPWSNERTDEYGGSLENRMRMPLELFAAVRAAVPHTPLWVRISASDCTLEAGMEKGWHVDEAITFCQRLKALGCAVVHVSSGGAVPQQVISMAPGYQLTFSRQIREATGMATIGVGLITEPGEAELALATGQADAIAIGRQFLFNPHWPFYAAQQLKAKLPYAPWQFWRSEPSPKQDIFRQPITE